MAVKDMHQGSPLPVHTKSPSQSGTPQKAAPAGPTPRGVQHQKESTGSTGANGRKAH